MDFESKFVLPKKVPVFLNEFVGFMEKTNAIDQLTAQNFIVAVPDAWKDYSTKSRCLTQAKTIGKHLMSTWVLLFTNMTRVFPSTLRCRQLVQSLTELFAHKC